MNLEQLKNKGFCQKQRDRIVSRAYKKETNQETGSNLGKNS